MSPEADTQRGSPAALLAFDAMKDASDEDGKHQKGHERTTPWVDQGDEQVRAEFGD